MRSLLRITVIFLFLAVLLSASLIVARPTDQANGPAEVEVVLTVESDTIKAGQTPVFRVQLINRTDKTIYLVGSLDGSDVGWRYPKITVKRTGPEVLHGPLRCGNMNNLREQDFVQLKPGESLDPFDRDRGFFSNYHLHRQTLNMPGKYTFTLTYDTNENDIGKWWGFMGPGEPSDKMKQMLAEVPKGTYVSNTVTVTVTTDNPAASADEHGNERPR